MPCESWKETAEVVAGGLCHLNLYGGRPSLGVCKQCPKNTTGGTWPELPVVVRAPAPPPQPVPHDKWPGWAIAIKAMGKKGELGVGDTVHRLLLNGMVKVALEAMGVPCGCSERRDAWNIMYSYQGS